MTNPLPANATWTDYVNSHGGRDTPGWWVTLCWYADPEQSLPEVVGPYPTYARAVSAMEDSLLIDSFAEDTRREDWLDDVYVATDPASIAAMCTDYGHRVTVIDPGDPHHHGRGDLTAADTQSESGICGWSAGMQAAALATTPPPPVHPAVGLHTSGNSGPAITP